MIYRKKHDYGKVAFEKMKHLFINTYPYVARHLKQKEQNRIEHLLYYEVQ